ncbi:unnamed protein product [Orchesella dallaii]|uniref:DDE Tnp4 domain-containing protein n=1 Tax=Orchesella dallaii TaxID=48710 RepID=A0ABP1PMU1_9HEXA
MPRKDKQKCAHCARNATRGAQLAIGNINEFRVRNNLEALTGDAKICETCWLKFRPPPDPNRRRGRPPKDPQPIPVVDEGDLGEDDEPGRVEDDEPGHGENDPGRVEGEAAVPPPFDDDNENQLLVPEIELVEFDRELVLNYPEGLQSGGEEEEMLDNDPVENPQIHQEPRLPSPGLDVVDVVGRPPISESSSSDSEPRETRIHTRSMTDADGESDDSFSGFEIRAIPDTLVVNMPPSTQSRCFICRNDEPGGRHRISSSAVLDLWKKMYIYLPDNVRCCSTHLTNENKYFSVDALMCIEKLEDVKPKQMTLADAARLISMLTMAVKSPPMNFTTYGFRNDKDYFTLTGLTKSEFDAVFATVEKRLRRSHNRDSRHAFAIFMMYLHLNISQQLLGVLFQMPQQRISDVVGTVRKLLMLRFVPNHLGYQHIQRQDYIRSHHTILASTICGAGMEQAIVVLDGTYFYCQKSSNYMLQRELWSMHKGRPLTKAMMVIAPDGYILAVEALYKANGENNDASILKDMVHVEGGFMTFFREGDMILYDRGFRDCSALAKRLNLQTRMPHFLPKGQKQHTTEEANDSRLTTALRWVVESANGRLKRRWKFLDGIIENTHLPHLGDFVKIGCALLNAFFKPLKTDNPGDKDLAEEMLERAGLDNLLKNMLEEKRIPKTGSANWLPIADNDLVDFPQISEDELRKFTFGIYQIKQAKSYTAEHKSGEVDRGYNLFQANERRIELPETDGILKFKLQSRHTSSVQHQLWIHYEKNGVGRRAIRAWYCNCKAGARVLGCCAHVTSVLWYLGFARYLPILKLPAVTVGRNLRDARHREPSPPALGDEQSEEEED